MHRLAAHYDLKRQAIISDFMRHHASLLSHFLFWGSEVAVIASRTAPKECKHELQRSLATMVGTLGAIVEPTARGVGIALEVVGVAGLLSGCRRNLQDHTWDRRGREARCPHPQNGLRVPPFSACDRDKVCVA